MTVLARALGFPAAGGNLEMEVRRGEVVLLRGPNGSGKTSLLRALAGLPSPLAARHVERGATRAWLPASPRDGLVGLTVAGEARLRRRPHPDGFLREQESTTLSGGEARRLGWALADGDLWLLDEPSEGLDAEGRERLARHLERVRANGAAVLAGHDPGLLALADRVVDLAPSRPAAPVQPVPPGPGPGIRAPATTATRGPVRIALPALDVAGGLHVITGPNGSGKTTLLEHLADAGGRAFVPTRPEDVLVGERVGDLAPAAALTDWGVAHLASRHPLALSRGEAQRVALAAAFSQDRPVLLDEPEAHLDADGRLRLAAAVHAHGCTCMATHDATWIDAATTRISLEARA